MKSLTRVAFVLAFLALGCVSVADECDLTAPRAVDIEAAGASGVTIIARAGSLTVTGHAGSAAVQAQGTACAATEALLAEVELTARRDGDQVVVEVLMPKGEGGWNGWGERRLDLEVAVPSDLPIQIEDTSGSLTVRGVAAVTIDDGSGEIDIAEVAGDVVIEDGSGSIALRRIGGDVRLDDGSGEIRVTGVDGGVWIEEDGSGEIDIRGVARDVYIEDDGSGGIEIADVEGSVTVREDGSGGISVRDVGGDFTVERDGSGGISHERVGGRVAVPEDDD